MKGMECELCPAILSDWNTSDWDGEGGNCDKCNEYLADASLRKQDYLEEVWEANRTGN